MYVMFCLSGNLNELVFRVSIVLYAVSRALSSLYVHIYSICPHCRRSACPNASIRLLLTPTTLPRTPPCRDQRVSPLREARSPSTSVADDRLFVYILLINDGTDRGIDLPR
jgi:hypothetical protein